MILINTKPIDDALADFFENNDTGSALYRLDFDEVIRRFPGTSQDNLDTNTIKVEALQTANNIGGGYAFLNLSLAPLDSNVLNFMTFVKIPNRGGHASVLMPTINSSDFSAYNILSFRNTSINEIFPKPNVQNIPAETEERLYSFFYIENFTEEALRAYPQFVSYYMVRHLLEVLHYNIFESVVPIFLSGPLFPQPNLGATNLKDVMHYFESYMYNALEGEDDRLVFMLHPLDYQRLIRLKDSAGNYVFCSNCVWDNVINLGKSVIVNAGWNDSAAGFTTLFAPERFFVFPKSKFRFIYTGEMYLKIVRNPANNRYVLELYVPSNPGTGIYRPYPFIGLTLGGHVFFVNYTALLGNV